MSFVETEERQALRAAVAELGAKYGSSYPMHAIQRCRHG